MNLFELQSVLGSGSRYQGNILYGSDTESRKDVMIGNVIYLFGKYLTLFFFLKSPFSTPGHYSSCQPLMTSMLYYDSFGAHNASIFEVPFTEHLRYFYLPVPRMLLNTHARKQRRKRIKLTAVEKLKENPNSQSKKVCQN